MDAGELDSLWNIMMQHIFHLFCNVSAIAQVSFKTISFVREAPRGKPHIITWYRILMHTGSVLVGIVVLADSGPCLLPPSSCRILGLEVR